MAWCHPVQATCQAALAHPAIVRVLKHTHTPTHLYMQQQQRVPAAALWCTAKPLAGNTVFAVVLLQVDKLIQSVAVGLGLSMSGWVWNNMHNKHHATPNKVGTVTTPHLFLGIP